MAVMNTLAYYNTATIRVVKSFKIHTQQPLIFWKIFVNPNPGKEVKKDNEESWYGKVIWFMNVNGSEEH